ncbi:MAG: efflux RND transporter permease subunit, partial [Muribaculaceae bacterium]|nr:efflux RND transporter permease subunit [Muribaculaceae bacterium]
KIGLAAVNSAPAVIITVTKQPKASTIDLNSRILSALDELAPTLPADISINTDIFRQADFIETSISNLQEALLEGALMVIVVLLFFLMNLRTTLISVVALPLSIIVSMLVLNLMGFTINTMSLGGIAIAIGSLVDDAIVDVENVYRHLRNNAALPDGKRLGKLEVIYRASAEVRTPIFNSSLIIIASFMPLFFLSGIEGRLLMPLGIAFIVALVASTIVALTVTPVLCSILLGNKAENARLSKEPATAMWLRNVYTRALEGALKHPGFVLTATVILFAGACATLPFLGRGFLPKFNEGSFTINLATLPGVSLEESDKIGRQADSIIMAVPEIKTVARKTGRAELDEHSQGVNASEIEAPYVLADRSREEIAAELRRNLGKLPGVNVEIGQPISH